jgi:hypothetical protein
MKLLISTYACAPNRGSEHGVGWNWTTEAHRLGHEVWALVSPAHKVMPLSAASIGLFRNCATGLSNLQRSRNGNVPTI